MEIKWQKTTSKKLKFETFVDVLYSTHIYNIHIMDVVDLRIKTQLR